MDQCPLAYVAPCSECAQFGNCSPSKSTYSFTRLTAHSLNFNMIWYNKQKSWGEYSTITLIARLKSQPGKEALLAEECIKLAKKVRENEKGCLMYIPHVSTENPAEIVFVEKYIDQEAFNAHGQTPYFKAFREKRGELVDGDSQIQFIKELI